LKIRVGDQGVVREEQTFTVSGRESLHLHNPGSGGLRVSGWDGRDFEVTACKAGRSSSDLSRAVVTISGGKVSLTGVDDEDVVVFFLVKAPKGATLDLAAVNGPVSLRDVHGNVALEVTNGPVSIGGGGGAYKVEVVNGPVTFRPSGTGWEGNGLDASVVNGPLTLAIPDGFASGIRVTSPAHSPFLCRAAACQNLQRTGGERERIVEFGSGAPVLRLSTVNGPVSIKDATASASVH
jgi:hypothetical protein